jgi:hypothetical protein
MSNVSLELALDVLDISNKDLDGLTEEKLKSVMKSAKSKWHPDKVSSLNNPELTKLFTKKFQLIEPALLTLKQYLTRNEYAENNMHDNGHVYKSNVDVIRENADHMKSILMGCWSDVVEKGFLLEVKEEVLRAGESLKELLSTQQSVNLPYLAVLSFISFTSIWGAITIVFLLISPLLGLIAFIFWLLMLLFNFIAILPLSDYWLPAKLDLAKYWFVNFGLSIYNLAARSLGGSRITMIYLSLLRFIAGLFKYIIILPLNFVIKLLFGNKVVGRIVSIHRFYAEVHEDKIMHILSKDIQELTEDELYTLSHLYSNLTDVKKVA